MVIQTDLLGRLVKEGYNVCLIAPDAKDENLKTYSTKASVELRSFAPQSSFWTQQYTSLRKYFLEDIDNNVALREKHIRAVRKDGNNTFLSRLRFRLAYMTYRLIRFFPALREWVLQRERRHLTSPIAAALLEELQPRMLVATYPVNFAEGMLLKAANDRPDTQTVIHLLSWDNISCKGHFPQLADQYLAWGEVMREEFEAYYAIATKDVHKVGVPHFDVHLTSRQAPDASVYLQKLRLNTGLPYLFFGMSSPRFAPHEIDIVEWLAEQVEANVLGKDMQLVIRPHPQNVQGNMADASWLPRLEALAERDRIGVSFPTLTKSRMPWSMQEADMVELSQLLASCTVSLNSGSTLSIDALMCGRPVVLTAFDGAEKLDYWASARRLMDYPHLHKLVAHNGVSVVQNYTECLTSLQQYLEEPTWKAIERERTLARYCEKPELTSTDRVVDVLVKIMYEST